jgi:acetyl-CoA carboxylase biotin carboxyl carrier protein
MTKKTKASPSSPSNGNGALSKLQAVYEFMTQHNLDTIELDEEGTHLKMVRRKALPPMQIPVPVYAGAPAAGASAPAAAAPAGAPAPAAPAAAEGTPIKSTMMGIFYRAPSPSSPPFVKEGETVKAGQILCMIEAMKVFNEIKAEYPCVVVKTLLDNGKPVKSGQDIFLVKRI